MPKFSIIVPVYNAEKTLHRCLDSVIGQTEQDFEVILSENGSKDKSREICFEYAEKDERFVLYLSDENRGPSAARNAGLDRAKGEIIVFLDSDDFFEKDHLETAAKSLEKADAVFFGYKKVLEDGTVIGEFVPEIHENADYYEKLIRLKKQDMFGYTWIKAFRKESIGDTRFDEKLNLLEDEIFTCEVLSKNIKIAVAPKAVYNYVTGNPKSLVARIHPDYCVKTDAAYRAWKKLLENFENKESELSAMAESFVERSMYYGFEHEINQRDFFSSLRGCSFFKETEHRTLFEKYAENEKYIGLCLMRKIYRGKVFAYRLIKGRGRK